MLAAFSQSRKGHSSSLALVLQGSPTEAISKQGNNLMASFQVRFSCSSLVYLPELRELPELHPITESSADA